MGNLYVWWLARQSGSLEDSGMDQLTTLMQTTPPGLLHSLSTRLSANRRCQFLLIAVLLVTWSFTGTHSAMMAAPSTALFAAVNAADGAFHHSVMDHHPNVPGDPSVPHGYCVDHCLSAMLPASSSGGSSHEVTLPPEIQSAHWEPWWADLTPPPPKHGSFTTLT